LAYLPPFLEVVYQIYYICTVYIEDGLAYSLIISSFISDQMPTSSSFMFSLFYDFNLHQEVEQGQTHHSIFNN